MFCDLAFMTFSSDGWVGYSAAVIGGWRVAASSDLAAGTA
jgi:hypothetical protein